MPGHTQKCSGIVFRVGNRYLIFSFDKTSVKTYFTA